MSAEANGLSNAMFCNGGGQGRAMKLFAAQKLTNGNLKFGVSVWQANGQNFTVVGVARRAHSGWVYEEHEGRPAKLVCRLQIDWRGSRSVRIIGDDRADCEADAGYGFGAKAVSFTSADYAGAVAGQLRNSEEFMNAQCAKRRGKPG
jgi:hypothetical protein